MDLKDIETLQIEHKKELESLYVFIALQRKIVLNTDVGGRWQLAHLGNRFKTITANALVNIMDEIADILNKKNG